MCFENNIPNPEKQENIDTDLISRKAKERRERIKFAIEKVTKKSHEEQEK